MAKYIIERSVLSGSIEPPPSKSNTLRAILFATMASGESKVRNYLHSKDTFAMLNACKQLGAEIEITPNTINVLGVSGNPKLVDNASIDAGNSGQVLRFITAVSVISNRKILVTGDESILSRRPIEPLIKAVTALGAKCQSINNDNRPPLIVNGPISPGTVSISGEDSQPVSGIIIAACFLKGTTEIFVKNPGERPWIELTLSWLAKFGIQYVNQDFRFYRIYGKGTINNFDYTVSGDFSSIAYPIAASIITKSQIEIKNIDMKDPQGDKKVLNVLQKMGANIEIQHNKIIVKPCDGLTGVSVDVNDFIDALPILAVIGCYAEGVTRLFNAEIARKKESDRLSSITQELTKMGAKISEYQSYLIITGAKLYGSELYSYNDHRIAMSLIVAALGASFCSIIHDIDCIAKSYPNFSEDMVAIGCRLRQV